MRRALAACALALALAPGIARADLQVTGTTQVTPRLTEFAMTSDALAGPTHVRVLLPDGYGAQPARRYPVLYLLHGAFDDFRSWTAKGDAEAITAGAPMIVVMPDGGQGGWYADWVNRGRGGPPQWERFHLGQLVPWVDATFRTVAAREGRALAGLSMGGFGALSYAARHPDDVVAAFSFSGAVDIVNNAAVAAVIAIEAPVDGGAPGDQFGDRVTHEIGWRARNPWDLAGNLRGMRLGLATGNGQRGPADGPGLPDVIEQQVRQMTLSLHRRLDALGIAHDLDDYGAGTHTWPYWQRELRDAVPVLTRTFAAPPKRPARTTFTAAEPDYEIDGWTVDHARTQLRMSTLRDAGRHGFTLRTSSPATVTTPPVYTPRRRYRTSAGPVRADARGRLRFRVDRTTTVRVRR